MICTKCSECVVVTPCGFATAPYLYCMKFQSEVTKHDYCSFGSYGSPGVASTAPDISIEGQAAVYGDRFIDE